MSGYTSRSVVHRALALYILRNSGVRPWAADRLVTVAGHLNPQKPWRRGLVTRSTTDRIAGALNVALSWLDNPTQGTTTERDDELAGCREVLREWTDAD